MNGFLIQCRLKKAELFQYMGILFGGFLIGIIILTVMMAGAKEESCATIGTLVAVLFFAFVHLFSGAVSFAGEFNLAVSMGVTRKSFVGSYTLFTLAEIALLEAEILLLGWLEKWLIGRFFPDAVMELDMTSFFTWEYLLGVLAGFTIVELFIGAFILKYGYKMLWVLWALWMAGSLLLTNVEKSERIAGYLADIGILLGGRITPQGIFMAAVILAALIAAATWNMLKKQRVTA